MLEFNTNIVVCSRGRVIELDGNECWTGVNRSQRGW